MSAMNYLQDSALVQKYRAQKVVNIGKDDQLNRETIVALQPDGMMVYPYDGGSYDDYVKAGITVLYNAEYLEENPLGRAEWIKMAGLIAGKEKQAMDIFLAIETQYREAKNLAHQNMSARTVILGKPIDNVWHVPGNQSFAAQMVKDAGAVYRFSEVEGNNVQSKSSEWVLANAAEADYWIFTDYTPTDYTLAELVTQNKIYPHLGAVKKGHVVVCNSAKADFFGKGVIEPHVMLRDMIFHFHGVPKDYVPVYFKKLK
jgi:iron complex transport system substrate-binding protein